MPVLDLIWIMLILFLFIAWLLVVIGVVTDVFRSDDLSALAKAGWMLFIIVIPWLGVIVYLIARGDSLAGRYRTFGSGAAARPWVRTVPLGDRSVDVSGHSSGSYGGRDRI